MTNPVFENASLDKNENKHLNKKLPKMLPFLWVLQIKKNHNELPKLAQLAKIDQSGHPEFGLPLKYKTMGNLLLKKGLRIGKSFRPYPKMLDEGESVY
jgi:hypothetical protein